MTILIRSLRIGRGGSPSFLPTATPVISWQIASAPTDWVQDAWRLELRHGDAPIARVEHDSGESQHVSWPFDPLSEYDEAEIRVAVRGADGDWSEPSEWARIRTAVLGPDGWIGAFIASPDEPGNDRRTVRFRRIVEIDRPVRRAILSSTVHGVVEPTINGTRVSDEVLAPGWTAYESRLLFSSADVTALLDRGANVLGATVAEGWYRERFGFDGRFSIAYPGPPAFSAQLWIEYQDGSVETIVTDAEWETSVTGPVVSASIYQGERFDARLDDTALADAQAALPDAAPAIVIEADLERLRPAGLPPVRRIERMPVAETIASASGGRILDFGQNLVGWLELAVDLPEGHELTLRHAEVLENGELGLRPLRFAAATDTFIADGDGPRTWSPRFTFHGFRYAQIDGLPDDVPADAIIAVVVHSDLKRTGHLTTSDPMLNKLHENVVWGMRGNFLSIPTDCPQRDERLGWTGDIQVFTPTASFLYDVSAFLESWLVDLAAEQAESGVPFVIPSPLPEKPPAAAAWGDAATLVPDAVYERYGDPRVLDAQFESMRRWVDTLHALAGDGLWTGTFQFGDWLDPAAPPNRPNAAKADADIVANAYYFRSASRVAAAARVLGRGEDAERYGDLAERVRAAFLDTYVTPSGRLMSDAHTAYALAIVFGIVEGEQRQKAGARLAELARSYGYRVRTGFVGTPLVCDALSATGHLDTAYRMLLERGNPSWLYPITMGATTIWERWDSMLPDGSINPGEMTSFNHYALGAVADWMQRTIGGIAPLAPGYRVVGIRPRPGGGLTSAQASFETGYGAIRTSWTIDHGRFRLHLEVPVGVEAVVTLPGADAETRVGAGEYDFEAEALAPAASAPVFSLDSALADFVDDPVARESLMGFFREIGYFIALGWDESGSWRSDARLGSSLMMFPDEQRPRLEELLEGLNR